jgi:hypothetical protein
MGAVMSLISDTRASVNAQRTERGGVRGATAAMPRSGRRGRRSRAGWGCRIQNQRLVEKFRGNKPVTRIVFVPLPNTGASAMLRFTDLIYKTATDLMYKTALGKRTVTRSDEDLLAKVGKGQSKLRARYITNKTEEEYDKNKKLLSEGERKKVELAISDYTMGSNAINDHLRGVPGAQDKSRNVENIDAMFTTYNNKNLDRNDRVTYRLATYKKDQIIPYGAKQPTSVDGEAPTYAPILVGDTVTDLAYVSASENRQLLGQGVLNPSANTRYVKFVIVGTSGINISGGSMYTNENERTMHQRKNNGIFKGLFTIANAGQAEILYPRGTVFRVDLIKQEGDDVRVKLSVLDPAPGGVHKNMFNGL